MFKEIAETLRVMNPSQRQLRWFGAILAFLSGIAAFYAENYSARTAGFTAGFVLIFLTAAFPRLIKPVWLTLFALTLPIGWLISRILLIGFFYLIVTPASLLLVLFRRDILKLKKGKESTYWEDFEENKNPDSIGL